MAVNSQWSSIILPNLTSWFPGFLIHVVPVLPIPAPLATQPPEFVAHANEGCFLSRNRDSVSATDKPGLKIPEIRLVCLFLRLINDFSNLINHFPGLINRFPILEKHFPTLINDIRGLVCLFSSFSSLFSCLGRVSSCYKNLEAGLFCHELRRCSVNLRLINHFPTLGNGFPRLSRA